ncbi:hypothetical protein HanXRQr2_Chr06g0246741 [Helianthus annuus]|uniref:Uncharacterized protein n=1 Tax=Helianthus annuus TaxID=4232 RepID=A0A9K3NIC2_HELAN|nr:hypothetical protein HanXRQr2_Chr06g0246741 [Helianthus annuus]
MTGQNLQLGFLQIRVQPCCSSSDFISNHQHSRHLSSSGRKREKESDKVCEM